MTTGWGINRKRNWGIKREFQILYITLDLTYKHNESSSFIFLWRMKEDTEIENGVKNKTS